MELILCFSPHLDDVILSCVAKLLKDKSEGKRIRVETIFTLDGDRKSQWSKLDYEKRREEDFSVFKQLGAQVEHWQMKDAPFRNSLYSDWESIVTKFSEKDKATVLEIKNRMWEVIKTQSPQEILLPLGVGGHVDHRIVFLAGLEMCREKDLWKKVWFYEDRPYILVDGALEARLISLRFKSLQVFSFLKLAPKYFVSLIGFQMTKSHSKNIWSRFILGAKLLLEVLKGTHTVNMSVKLKPTIIATTSDYFKDITSLIKGYSSQFEDLYHSERYLLERSLKYSIEVFQKSGFYCERFWQVSDIF